MINYLFTFSTIFFFSVAIYSAFYVCIDFILSLIYFIFTGKFDSVVQLGFLICSTSELFCDPNNYKINTLLKGFDLIINWFVGLQFSSSGRFMLIFISSLIALIIFIFGKFFNFKLIDKSSDKTTPNDISIIFGVSMFIPIFFFIPVYGAFLLSVINFFK